MNVCVLGRQKHVKLQNVYKFPYDRFLDPSPKFQSNRKMFIPKLNCVSLSHPRPRGLQTIYLAPQNRSSNYTEAQVNIALLDSD